jgi:hypothetical protein
MRNPLFASCFLISCYQLRLVLISGVFPSVLFTKTLYASYAAEKSELWMISSTLPPLCPQDRMRCCRSDALAASC